MKNRRLAISLAIVALILVAVVPVAGAAAPESGIVFGVPIEKGEPDPPPILRCPDRCSESFEEFRPCGCGGKF